MTGKARAGDAKPGCRPRCGCAQSQARARPIIIYDDVLNRRPVKTSDAELAASLIYILFSRSKCLNTCVFFIHMAKETQNLSAVVCYEKSPYAEVLVLVTDSKKGRAPKMLKLIKCCECVELTLFWRNTKKYIAVSGPVLHIKPDSGKREVVRVLEKDENVAIIWDVLHVKTIEDFEMLMVKLLQRYS